MFSLDERKKIIGEVSRRAFDATSPEGLGLAVMPLLEKLVDTSASLFYRINDQGHLVPLAGTCIDAGYRYSREYYEIDPLQGAMRDENPWIFRTERSPTAWRDYLDGPVYQDLCRAQGIHSFLHVRLVKSEHGVDGMYALLLAHGERQPAFSPQDELDLIEVLPALEGAIRRSSSAHALHGSAVALEAALNSLRRPTVMLDARGGLVWASRRARALLGWDRGGKPVVPKALREGAMELGALLSAELSCAAPSRSLQLVGLDGEFVSVDFRTARMAPGVPVIVAELNVVRKPRTSDLAARFNLTMAQANVLTCLAHGCSDKAIAERNGISLATVRSHLCQIFSRLGVESRLQAGLLAARYTYEHGNSANDDDDDAPLASGSGDE